MEAIKGLLRKKGSGTPPKGSLKKDRKTATFAEAVTKVAATKKPAPKITHNKNVNQEGGRAIRGSAVMGFSIDPKKCLDEAAGDLRQMGCAIYFKQCQEVNTIARQLLLGAPNTIEDEIIQQTFDEELKLVEDRLISENNAEYR